MGHARARTAAVRNGSSSDSSGPPLYFGSRRTSGRNGREADSTALIPRFASLAIPDPHFWCWGLSRSSSRRPDPPLLARDRDRGAPHGAAPPTPPGIRVTYHGGSTGYAGRRHRVGADRVSRTCGCAGPVGPRGDWTCARTPSANRRRPRQGTLARHDGAVRVSGCVRSATAAKDTHVVFGGSTLPGL